MDTLSLKLPLHRTNGSRTERRITTDISTINRNSNSEGRPEPVCPLSCLPFETWLQRHTDANGHRRQMSKCNEGSFYILSNSPDDIIKN